MIGQNKSTTFFPNALFPSSQVATTRKREEKEKQKERTHERVQQKKEFRETTPKTPVSKEEGKVSFQWGFGRNTQQRTAHDPAKY